MDYFKFSVLGSVLLFFILIPLYLHFKQGKYQRITMIIKGLSTMIPILFCMSTVIQLKEEPYLNINSVILLPDASCWLLAGLLLGLVGDIVLCIHFVGGMGAFLLGHICYIIAYCKFANFQLWSIGLFIVLLLLSLVFFHSLIPKMGKNKIPFLIYGTVILVMVSIALLLPFSIGSLGILPAVGAFLFVLSDLLLARNILVKVTALSDAVSLYCYYAGQFILAMSVYLYTLFV